VVGVAGVRGGVYGDGGRWRGVLFAASEVDEWKIMPFNAILSGFAYFVLGSSYWGRMYAIAAAFFVVAFVMLLDIRWATLEYGATWVVSLTMIGLHLRHLGRRQEADRHPR